MEVFLVRAALWVLLVTSYTLVAHTAVSDTASPADAGKVWTVLCGLLVFARGVRPWLVVALVAGALAYFFVADEMGGANPNGVAPNHIHVFYFVVGCSFLACFNEP